MILLAYHTLEEKILFLIYTCFIKNLLSGSLPCPSKRDLRSYQKPCGDGLVTVGYFLFISGSYWIEWRK
jgi:hypothetical protein